jgi:hypothetical protein
MPLETRGYAFLSYSRKDEAAAQQIVAAMQAHGLKVWRDVDQIEPGTLWQKEMEKGLLGASAILYLASKNSAESKWIAYELAAFRDRGSAVIPIILDDAGPSAIPSVLRDIQWLDARHGLEHVVDRIAHVLSRSVAPESQPLPPSQPKTKGYVFLSYAEEDDDFLKVLRPFLKEHGYAYWDYQESSRDYHGQFIFELEQVIIEAAATLSVLSDSWRASKWALREYLFADEVKTPVILLRDKPMRPTLAISGTPYIDFVASVPSGIERLHRELQKKGL